MKLFLRGSTWWVSHGTGKTRIRQSTGRTDREEAEKVAREICAPAMLRVEADIVKVAGDIAAGKRRNADMLEAAGRRIDACLSLYPFAKKDGSEPSKHTLASDRQAWWKLTDFCKGKGVELVGHVTEELANEFLMSCTNNFRDKAYLYCRKHFAVMGIDPNPFRTPPPVDASLKSHHEPLTMDELAKVMAYLESKSYKHHCHDNGDFALMFRFMVYTGLRMGDAAMMTVDQCDFEHGVIRRRMQKTRKIVEFPMHRVLMNILPREGGWLFPSLAEAYMKNPTHVSERFTRVFRRVGLWRGNGIISGHSLRATFATICCEAGVPLAVIQSWLGHSSEIVTRIYAHFNDMEKKREAIEKFPEF